MLLVVYIITSNLIESISVFDKGLSNMSKINHVKGIMKDLSIFRGKFRDRQDVSDEIQTNIYLIKDELQTSIEKLISQDSY